MTRLLLLLLLSRDAAAGALDAAFRCRESFRGVVATLRVKLRQLDAPVTLTVDGKPITVDRVLGKKSSVVFLSADGKQVVKVYDSAGEGQANF